MSNVNIKRAVENIRASTTVYTPLVEIIVNAIQAIEERDGGGGEISIRALRSNQAQLDGSLPDISGFEVEDNGVGFTDEHRDSFDTLYTDRRITDGGKGFGRFICLKYFQDFHVRSVYGAVRVHGLHISPGTWFTVSPTFEHLMEVLTCPGTKLLPWTNEGISSPITSKRTSPFPSCAAATASAVPPATSGCSGIATQALPA